MSSYLPSTLCFVVWKGREEERKELGKGKEKERGKKILFLCVFGCRREEKGEKWNKIIILQ